MNINEIIRNFIEDNLIIFDDEINVLDDDNIFKLGFVNSLFAVKLVSFIEGKFNIIVDSEDMEISNFNTVNNIVKYIERKRTNQ